MRHPLTMPALAALLALLSDCATVPGVTRPYYFPEARADIVITQTLGCMVTTPPADSKTKPTPGDKPSVRSAVAADVKFSYVPNYDSPNKHSVNLADVDFLLSDSDVALTLTDDGRLASINSTNAGEAAAIVKSALSVAAVFTGVKTLNAVELKEAKQNQITYCQAIIDFGAPVDVTKQPGLYTMTLTYKQRLAFPGGNTILASIVPPDASHVNPYRKDDPVPVPLDPGSTPFPATLNPFPSFSFTVTTAQLKDIQPSWTDAVKQREQSHFEVPAMMLLAAKMSGPVADMSQPGDFWSDTALVPTDTTVAVPLPKAPWFGRLTTSVQTAVPGSGLVTKVEYNKTNGLADLFSAGAQIVNQANPPPPAPKTEAQKAADIQAQADLIYQQQRLVSCQLDPKNCPAK